MILPRRVHRLRHSPREHTCFLERELEVECKRMRAGGRLGNSDIGMGRWQSQALFSQVLIF